MCANFGYERLARTGACSGAWHAACYRQKENDCFPVLEPGAQTDDLLNLEALGDDEDDVRFTVGRSGDHLMCPFQCDRCQFHNLKGREVNPTVYSTSHLGLILVP